MTEIFEKIIKEQVGGGLSAGDFPLAYLKFSTVTSGATLNDKVVFFVFKNKTPSPFLCVKTVRNYGAREAIYRNFNNLKKLNALTAGSSHARLFAQALYLHDDGENVFSIETACPGERITLNRARLQRFVAEYVDFQEHVAKGGGRPARDMEELANEAVRGSGTSAPDQRRLLEYIAPSRSSLRLPRVIQHGDLTADNILSSNDALHIVDYDYVGVSDIPGLDLFGLFCRFDQSETVKLCRQYFPAYFKKIGAMVGDNDYRALLFVYYLIGHPSRKPERLENASAERIVGDFERLFPEIL